MVVTNLELMRVAYNNYENLRDLSISKRQFELITYLDGKKATSRDIANKYNICVQNASQQLNNVYRKGYLIREEISDKTGGYIFQYTANPFLFSER